MGVRDITGLGRRHACQVQGYRRLGPSGAARWLGLCLLLLGTACTQILRAALPDPALSVSMPGGASPGAGANAAVPAAGTNLQTDAGTAAGTAASPELARTYAALAAGSGHVYALDPARSQVRILAFRGGRVPALGHNHVLTVPAFAGFAYVPAGQGPAASAGARFDLEFSLEQLVLDAPAQRAALGPGFASVLSRDDIASTRAHMLGPDNLQAQQYPRVRIQGRELVGEAPHLAARVAVELHGQTHEYWVALNVQGLPDTLQADGSFVVAQSDFGVQPYSALAGLLAVRDQLLIDFHLAGQQPAPAP